MKISSLAAILLLVGNTNLHASAAATRDYGGSIVKSLMDNPHELVERRERRHLQELSAPAFLQQAVGERGLEDKDQDMCDEAFMSCLPDNGCVACFVELDSGSIDWASVASTMNCPRVVSILNDAQKCLPLQQNQASRDIFCATFEACVVFEDEQDHDGNDDDEDFVDCTALTECNWPGYHPSFIGDGVCNDNMHGCYNTAICNWDGGDCCKDTCAVRGDYVECGHDGYACRNPNSEGCDPYLTSKCPNGNANDADIDPSSIICGYDETKYRVIMYDSFGDGWDTTKLVITDYEGVVAFDDGLASGSQQTNYICLSKNPMCYSAQTSGGVWGIEVSWEIKPMNQGSPAVASGGAPMNCDFSIAGEECETTCNGKSNVDPNDDPDYKSYKDLYACIEDKCMIQLKHCTDSTACAKCFTDDAPDYCFGLEAFNALVDCSICSCTDADEDTIDYCQTKVSPNIAPPRPGDDNGPRPCTPAETIDGSNALILFSQCTDFDELIMMVTKFDNHNFGQLDTFETCAHSFANDPNHGERTALSCMQILKQAIDYPSTNQNSDAPVDAISALAQKLYNDPHNFCDCAVDASQLCPLCPSFAQFKTLLYEALDACQSLDEIDCDAWKEFSGPCQDQMRVTFAAVNFDTQDKCDYVANGCNGSGPFPSFRKMDCAQEIPKRDMDFYNAYADFCLKESSAPVMAPSSPNTPDATPMPSAVTPQNPTIVPYTPSDSPPSPTLKPYVPTDGGGSNSNGSDVEPSTEPKKSKKKKKSHFFRNLVILGMLGGAVYYYYKQRSDTFSFSGYRMTRNFDYDSGMGESEMYANMNSSTSFEPPSLPPPPTAMGSNHSQHLMS